MASFDDLLCQELNDADDVEVLEATLRSLERLPEPPECRLQLAAAGPSDGELSTMTVPWCRRQVVCRTLNGDNDCRILRNLLESEIKCRSSTEGCSINYFEAGVQPDIQPYMRDMVTAWMLEVCEVERCADEVFPLSVAYLDRFLSAPAVAQLNARRLNCRLENASLDVPSLRRSQLQLVAASCMFLASKYRDSAAIPATQLVMYTDFSITLDQLLECELMVLQAIDWELSLPTPHDYFDHLLRRLPLTTEQRVSVRRHAHTFAAMCITDTTFLCCPTSTMAVACISAALSGLMGRRWCSDDEVGVVSRLQLMTSVDATWIKSWQSKIEHLLNNYKVGSSSSSTQSSAAVDLPTQNSGDVASDKVDDITATVSDNGHQGCFQRQLSTPADVRDICLAD